MRYRAVLRWTGLLLFLLGLVACRRLPSPDPIVDRLAQEGIVETPTMTRTLAASSSTTIVAATSTPESSVTPVFTPSPTLTPIPTLTATPAPPPPELPFFGVQLVRFSSSQIDRITQAGAYLTRFDRFHWDRIEPVRTDPPSYNWTAVDEIGLQRLVDNDVQMIGVIQFAPFWAQKIQGYACGPIKEDALEAFGQFMNALVTRFGGPPYNIRYWEIGNEPDVWHTQVTGRNQFGCWGDSETPYFGGEYYGQMLRTVYPQVKAADPEAQVLVGGLLLDCDPDNPPESPPGSGQLKDCSSTKFLEGILNSGAGPYFDGVSFHAYDYYYQDFGYFGNVDWDSGYLLSDLYPVLRKKAQFLENLLNRYGHPDKYLVNSESSLLCGSGKEGFCFSQDFSRAKAAYAAQTLATSLAMDFHAYIWYSLDANWRATDLEGEAYQAFQFATSQLGGATFQGPVTGYQELVGYRFSRDDGELWVVWSGDAEPHSFPLPEGTATIYNMFGAPLDHSSFIEVDFSPVYLEFSP